MKFRFGLGLARTVFLPEENGMYDSEASFVGLSHLDGWKTFVFLKALGL